MEIKEVEAEEIPEIDGMETNIEDSFNDDPLSDVFSNEQNLTELAEEQPNGEAKKEPDLEPEVKKEEPKTAKKEETADELMQKITGLNQALAEERERKRVYQQRVYDLEKSPGNENQNKDENNNGFDWKDPNKTIDSVKSELNQEMNTKFLNMSQAQAELRHEDFKEKYDVFKSLATSNPSLVNTMMAQPDPAEWVYQQATSHMAMQEIGNDPGAYREKLKAEILAELKGNNTGKIKEMIEKTPLPPSANAIKGKIDQGNKPIIHDDPLSTIEAGNR